MVQTSPKRFTSHPFGFSTGSPNISTNCDLASCDVAAVGGADVGHIDHRVLHRRVDLRVAKKLLHLLDGHTLVDGARREGAAELVRMDLRDVETAAERTQTDLHAADAEPAVGLGKRDEKGRIVYAVGEGTYTLDGNKITVTIDNSPISGTVDGGKITLSDEDLEMVFEKQ